MRGPDGNEYPMVGVFREVAAPERLVFTYVAVDGEGNPILDGLTTVTFAEEGGKTKLTLETRAVALVEYAAAYLDGMEAGWTQSLERLAERVADADRAIVSTRVFDAPRELVFEAWTEPDPPGTVVGAEGLHEHLSRVRPEAGRRLALRHARPRRQELSERERFYRNSRGRSGSSWITSAGPASG